MKKEFLLRVVGKNGSGKNSIQPGVSGLRVGFELGEPGYLILSESATGLIVAEAA